MIAEAALMNFAVALFAMLNVIGLVGVFAEMTENQSRAEATRTAWSCALAVAVTLLVVTWVGQQLLGFFGITVHSLRAAGGVIVLIIGLDDRVKSRDHDRFWIILRIFP